jgi:hypothetical protein
LKINNIFKFDKECEELVYKLYSVGVPLSIDKALAVDFVTYNIESLLKADDTLKMLKNLYPDMHNQKSFFSPYASTETIIEALKKNWLRH